ncbi:hypothetical protein [Burkholderia sp. NFACC33-1]|uniref:Uncharacterized protein n=2 Tax=Burkholderiaceae TaxID=119060 RepID=A0A318IUP1_BURPY|nr:hypothetical protein [Burkholderia sp. NFACC33-1]PXX37647.1 hypothetical protein NA66_1004295 [Burkholderia pyrrocinia]SFW35838.1 hypothetical protein SAMN03159384_01500 [Burkholderia sp. NFACC33-1]SFX90599.1 hypothetical protein SAMN03159408_02563 [Burkholderia sp. NFPP32]
MDDIQTTGAESVEQTMAAALVDRGVWTREQADAMLAADAVAGPDQGFDPLVAASKPTAPPQGVDPIDAAVFTGPDNAAAYNFGAVDPSVQVDQAQDMAVRQLFVSEGVPASIGNHIGQLWNAAAANPPTTEERNVATQQAELVLQRQWGNDYEANLKAAQQEVQRMSRANPNLHDMLEVSGLGSNPWLITTIFNLAKARGRA